jgi:Domain of unknown function (DUF4249)
MKKIRHIVSIIFVSALISSCKKPYAPPIVTSDNNYLVVEGIINTGQDSTFIRLSRTVKISSTTTAKPELNAIITVESDQNNSYSLKEDSDGLYSSPALNLSMINKYRLRIKTANNKEYLSDFVEARSTPAIDSVTYEGKDGGAQIYANTHDPQNKTRYYRWDFDETWQYIAFEQSFYKLGADSLPVYRNLNSSDNLFFCYKSGHSKNVLIGSTAKLTGDVIFKLPVDFIHAESGKVSHGYSILLRQYALTEDGYNYWQILKKNTEQLGTIFDAQPSNLTGNIHCTTNPAEPVIGYLSASTVTTKRAFVDQYKLILTTPNYLPPPDASTCPGGTIHVAPESTFKERLQITLGSGDSVLTVAEQPIDAPAITAYRYTLVECVDCRRKAPFGTITKPVFWPY